MLPAGERLEAGDLAGREADDRLIANLELATRDGPDQIGLQSQSLVRGGMQLGPEQRVAALARALRVVHRRVRLPEQAGAARPDAAEGDPDAGAREDLGALDDERAVEALQQAPGHDLRLGGVDTLEQDGELVAAQTRDGIGIADGLPKAACDADEQLVAGGVTEAVVDGLEVVDVDEEDGDAQEGPA